MLLIDSDPGGFYTAFATCGLVVDPLGLCIRPVCDISWDALLAIRKKARGAKLIILFEHV